MTREVFENLRDEVFRCLFSEVLRSRDDQVYRYDVLNVMTRINMLLDYDCYHSYIEYIDSSDGISNDGVSLVNKESLEKMKMEVVEFLNSLKSNHVDRSNKVVYDDASIAEMIFVLDKFLDFASYSSNVSFVDGYNKKYK